MRCPTVQDLDVDALAQLYDSTVTNLLDNQVAVRRVTCRQRLSCTWFDDECREAKGLVRSLDRAKRHVGSLSDVNSPSVVAWRTQRRQYITLLRSKRPAFWTEHVNTEQSQPPRLWRSFSELLRRGRVPLSTDIDASDLHGYFDSKVADVRASTAGADPPSFTAAPLGCVLQSFSPVTQDDVVVLVKKLPNKQCSSDPLPTWLLKQSVDALAPFLCRLFNLSLACGVVPTRFKYAYITPLLKKADLDVADVKSYWTISNLSVISKLLERLVCRQLMQYLKDNRLLPDLQSAYRQHQLTENVVLRVLSDILLALDTGKRQCSRF